MECGRVELFALIRRDARVEGISIRGLANRYRVHRRTVRTALSSASPPERKPPARVAPKLDRSKSAIDAMLIADLDAPRKQRHTAKRGDHERALGRYVDGTHSTRTAHGGVAGRA